MMHTFSIRTTRRIEFVDITSEVRSALSLTGVKEGICIVFCPHTTAGVTINENADPSVTLDISTILSRIAPAAAAYSHTEGNSDSHVKSSLLGSSVTVIIKDSKLQLGTWQGIYFCESDGPRHRECWVKVIKG